MCSALPPCTSAILPTHPCTPRAPCVCTHQRTCMHALPGVRAHPQPSHNCDFHACAPTSVLFMRVHPPAYMHACTPSRACAPSPIHACAPPALAQFARSRGKGRGDSVIRGHRARDSVRGRGADSTCDSVIRGHAILCVAAAA